MNIKHAINLVAGVTTAAFLTACVTQPKAPKDLECAPDPRGPITIRYGVKNNKTVFEVKEKSNVHGRLGLVFKLVPENPKQPGVPNFEEKKVTLQGKPSNDGRNDWLNAESEAASKNEFIGVCAPENSTKVVQTYEYLIKIEDLGQLDPRVDVEPN